MRVCAALGGRFDSSPRTRSRRRRRPHSSKVGSGAMSTVALEPASRFTHAELAAIFNAGYEGYFTPFTLDEAAFRFMVTTFDDDLDASRVLLVDGEPAGICKLAIRADRGWIGGLGVAAAHRGKGLGEALMREVIDVAGTRGLREALARGADPERAGDRALREARLRDRARRRGVDARAARLPAARRPLGPASSRRRRGSRASGGSGSRGSGRTSRSRTTRTSKRSRATAGRSSSGAAASGSPSSRASPPTRRARAS